MPQPRFRSRTMRRVFVKTPGNRITVHHRKRKNAKATCHKCDKVLPGSKPFTSKNGDKQSKTQKRAERPYGGVLCSRCMRALMIQKARCEKSIALQHAEDEGLQAGKE